MGCRRMKINTVWPVHLPASSDRFGKQSTESKTERDREKEKYWEQECGKKLCKAPPTGLGKCGLDGVGQQGENLKGRAGRRMRPAQHAQR